MSKIIPALLAADQDSYNDFEEVKTKFEKLSPFLAEFDNWVQIDIADGEFVKSKTNLSFEELAYFIKLANIEFHLMIARAQNSIDQWIGLKPKRIIFHLESMRPEDIENIIQKCRKAQIEVGLALNPETPILDAKQWFEEIDAVMLMGVHPGYSGQCLLPDITAKIRLLRNSHATIKIEIDGGVRVDNIKELKDMGVDIFVISSGIFKSSDIGEAIRELKSNIQ